MPIKTSPIQIPARRITGPGQVRAGDSVLVFRSGRPSYEGKPDREVFSRVGVLHGGDEEEILLEQKGNVYFITNMLVMGTSWVKAAYVRDLATLALEAADELEGP